MATEQPDRRQKIVMGLGIITILLVSANLLTAVVKHFWPGASLQDNVMVYEIADVAPEVNTHVIVHGKRHKRFLIKRPAVAPNIEFDFEFNHEVDQNIDQELAELEREIEAHVSQLNNKLTIELKRMELEKVLVEKLGDQNVEVSVSADTRHR